MDTKNQLVRMSPRLHAYIKIKATKHNVSMNDLILRVLGGWMREEQRREGTVVHSTVVTEEDLANDPVLRRKINKANKWVD